MMCKTWSDSSLGFEALWELHGTGPSIVERFRQGSMDIGFIGLPPVIIGIDRGVAIKCVAGGHVEGTIMVAPARFSSYSEAGQSLEEVMTQFQGKRIGVPKRGSIHDVILNDLIQKVGMEHEIQIRNYDIADFMLLDMEENVIDAAVGTPALAAFLALYLKTKTIIPTSLLWPYNPSYGIIMRESLLTEQPELVEQVLSLHYAACKELREAPREIAGLIKKERELLEEPFILDTYRISPKYCAALPPEYVNSTMKFVATLQKLGYIQSQLIKEDIFNLSFIQKIHPEGHHYNDGINI